MKTLRWEWWRFNKVIADEGHGQILPRRENIWLHCFKCVCINAVCRLGITCKLRECVLILCRLELSLGINCYLRNKRKRINIRGALWHSIFINRLFVLSISIRDVWNIPDVLLITIEPYWRNNITDKLATRTSGSRFSREIYTYKGYMCIRTCAWNVYRI